MRKIRVSGASSVVSVAVILGDSIGFWESFAALGTLRCHVADGGHGGDLVNLGEALWQAVSSNLALDNYHAFTLHLFIS